MMIGALIPLLLAATELIDPFGPGQAKAVEHRASPVAMVSSILMWPTSAGSSTSGTTIDAGGFGAGVHASFPLLSEPISALPRSMRLGPSLVAGFDVLRWTLDERYSASSMLQPYRITANIILPSAGILWPFWVRGWIAVYPQIEAGYGFAWVSSSLAGHEGEAHGQTGQVMASAGALFRWERLAFQLELGTFGLRAGAGLSF